MRHTLALILASLALAAGAPAGAGVPRVITDIPVVHALVAQVMGDLGTPVLLLQKGADEHDFQLRPSQMTALSEAGLVVWVGPELTPWLERALAGTTAAQLALLDADGTRRIAYADGAHAITAAGNDHGGTDPHAWLDPGNAQTWLGLIAAELSRIDPDHGASYAANAATAAESIAAMDAAIAGQLAPVIGRPFVTFHDAFGYFIAHYGLNFAGSVALGDASAPGAARLVALQDSLAESQATCLFPEAQHDPALIAQLAAATGTRIGAALDPSGSALDPGPGNYAALMTGLATALTDCLDQ